MSGPILVAIDGSDSSRAALEFALTQFPGRQFSLLYVFQPLAAVTVEDFVFAPSAADNAKLRTGHEAMCNRFVADVLAGRQVSYEVHIMEGDARETINNAVDTIKPDFVVAGSHGRGVLARAMLGSVSSWLATNCHAPVLIVRK